MEHFRGGPAREADQRMNLCGLVGSLLMDKGKCANDSPTNNEDALLKKTRCSKFVSAA
jgi:hypothetical protein